MTRDQKISFIYEYTTSQMPLLEMLQAFQEDNGCCLSSEVMNIVSELNLGHIGYYADGFESESGKNYPITPSLIKEFLRLYDEEKRFGFDRFLQKKFNGGIFRSRDDYRDNRDYRSRHRSHGSSGFGLFGFEDILKRGGVIICIIIAIVVAAIFVFGGIFPSTEKAEQSPAVRNAVDETMLGYYTINVEFEGNQSQLWLKEPYVMYIDDESHGCQLTIGYAQSIQGFFYQGEHDVWVQSGNSKSKVYKVVFSDNYDTLTFEVKVGFFGPSLNQKKG